jgi:hypothetical protein
MEYILDGFFQQRHIYFSVTNKLCVKSLHTKQF